MASRMLHYLIAREVANNIEITEMNRFIIGALLPDASSHSDDSYDQAHFEDRLKDRSEKGINWGLFEKKYEHQIFNDSLYLGYLCHLITDAIWFKRMIDKYVRIYPKKDRIQYIKQGYDDFRKMNAILIEEYNLKCPTLNTQDISIEEVNNVLIEPILTQFIEDFHIIGSYHIEELMLYPYEDVKEFIAESIEVCINEISALYGNREVLDPSVYYTKPRP